jgi:flagellar protein FlgJ
MTREAYTDEQKIAFIRQLYCPARAMAAETGCSWELILAQAAQETGWGEKVLPGTNNIFNIKASAGWEGESKVFHVWEKVGGKKIWVDAPFRVYPNVLASLKDRAKFLKSNPIYTKAGLFDQDTMGDFAKEAAALKKAGYATDENYVQALKDVWNGRTMRRAVAAAQEQGCGAQLPVAEILLKNGARTALTNTKVSVAVGARSTETVTDAQGAIAVRIAPGTTDNIVLKVFDAIRKEWAALDPVVIPDPLKSLTVTLLAPTVLVPTSTRVHDKPPASGPANGGTPAQAAPPSGTVKTTAHTIAKGETLTSIAALHKVRYKTIADLNGIRSPYIIRPGQVLRVPVAGGSDAPHAAAAPTSAPASGSGFDDFLTALHVAYYRDDADKPRTDVMTSMKAPWMKVAEEEFKAKVKRVPGKAANPHIIDYFKETSLNKKDAGTDETAWCAAFCNWCLVKAGYKGTHDALATSFRHWGRATRGNKPALGAVALIRFPDGRHHVTFVAGLDRSGMRLATLGGNQGNSSAVTHSHVPTAWAVCYRYPGNYPEYDDDYILHDVKADGAPLTAATTH